MKSSGKKNRSHCHPKLPLLVFLKKTVTVYVGDDLLQLYYTLIMIGPSLHL
jgi:hypothetical protein